MTLKLYNGGLWWPSHSKRVGNKRKTLTFGFGIHYVIPLQRTSGLASANINGVRAACGVTRGGHHAAENPPQGKPHVDRMELLTAVSIQKFPQISEHAFRTRLTTALVRPEMKTSLKQIITPRTPYIHTHPHARMHRHTQTHSLMHSLLHSVNLILSSL